MRLFAAVDIPDELKAALEAFLKRLRPAAKLSWSRPENLHITTQFIGEWPEARLAEVETALAAVPSPGAIDIAIKGLGWFPNQARPRVLWAGVEGSGQNGGNALRTLARTTAEALVRIGVAIEDRPYSPHLTLARMREAISLDMFHQALQSFPSSCGFDFGGFRAERFHLYLSAGGKYTPLADFPLE